MYFGNESSSHLAGTGLAGTPIGDIFSAHAHWVTRDTLLWKVPVSDDYTYRLHYDLRAGIKLRPEGITAGKQIHLAHARQGPAEAIRNKFPHLRGMPAFTIAPDDQPQVAEALRGQLAVSAVDHDGKLVDATGLQIPGVLDDLYSYDGPLGVAFDNGVPALCVWAPTAQSVKLRVFDDSSPTDEGTVIDMDRDARTGVWSVEGPAGWKGKYYLYEVEVFARSTGRIERNLVTDPYSVSLSTNSRRSQIVDLDDPGLMPEGWPSIHKPGLDAPEDIVLYELHVRDFSITDATVAPENRGTFRAFTEQDSNGMRHLRGLAEAGLTHIHLLPVFDIATIEEDRAARVEPDAHRLAELPPDSEEQQALLEPLRDRDGFNWGYDPYHFTVPEGSYATDPNGPARIREFREMVMALSEAGLCVVMDVVYNHTNASGQNPKSVLDKIVPGYYHRLDATGQVETSTCCQNTATEHAMMEKLMLDSLRTWATAYKVDGFRFDLMGHHMVANMVKARDLLAGLTPEKDGVGGSKIYLYGEGWDFGEVANNARGVNATQRNMAGTGIGTFSDRLRDAVRGGGAFSGLHEQGFATGLFTTPNETYQGETGFQRARLLLAMDQIRVGLAGNLRDYRLENLHGHIVSGHEVPYNGQPTGYALDPHEVVTYVEAHDNETFWDALQVKAPAGATLEQRVRMQQVANSVVTLAQGVPFFHAGQDLLRSKSLDRNSYNSGDWFNRLDWTYLSNNWGVGLPPGENKRHWPIMKQILRRPELKPGKAEIENTAIHFREMLRIRRSSPLFRLRTADQIQQKVHFLNTGPGQIPGLIVMQLLDTEPRIDGTYERIVVMFNATPITQTFAHPDLQHAGLELHPVQAASGSAARSTAIDGAGALSVPAYTTAVFVSRVRS